MLIAELDSELMILAMAGVSDVNLTEPVVNLMGPRVPVQLGLDLGASLMVMAVLYVLGSQGLTVSLQMYCPPA
jgi:hypothetical protein